jgi:hypothetical protein
VNSSCEHPIASTDGNFASIQLALARGEFLIEFRTKAVPLGSSRKQIFLSQGIIERLAEVYITSFIGVMMAGPILDESSSPSSM